MYETIPGKVPREGTSEQTTIMPCNTQSFSSNAICAERRLFQFPFFSLPPFSIEFHLQAAKTSMIFCWAYFPLHLHFPFAYRGPFMKKFSMPTESSPSEVAPSGFLPNIFSKRQEGFGVTRGSPLCCQAPCCDSSLQLTSKLLIHFLSSF